MGFLCKKCQLGDKCTEGMTTEKTVWRNCREEMCKGCLIGTMLGDIGGALRDIVGAAGDISGALGDLGGHCVILVVL